MSAQIKLPNGFRFRPTQKELIFHLRNWVSGEEIPPAAGVRLEDIYGDEEPWEMWERWGVKEDAEAVYVLTELKTRDRGGRRINRAFGKSGGSWNADGKAEVFSVETEGAEGKKSLLVCQKKGYTYKKKKSSSSESSNQFRWVMKEYSCYSLYRDRVICKLGRKELVVNGDGSSSGVVINHGVLDKNPGPEMVMPPGVRFCPTKEELVGYYLYNMVTKGRADLNECDLYDTDEPWEVWDRFAKEGSSSSKDLYFFTKLKRQRPPDARISRRVGNGGIWNRGKGSSFKVKIMISDESKGSRVLSGEKTVFGYRTEKKSSERGKWSLHEYSCQDLSKEVVVGVLRNRGGCAVTEEEPAEEDDLDAKRKKMKKKGIGGSVEEEEGTSHHNDDPERRRMNVAGDVDFEPAEDGLDTERKKKKKKGIGGSVEEEEEEGSARNDVEEPTEEEGICRHNDDDPERRTRMNVAGDAEIEDDQVRIAAALQRFKEEEDHPEEWLKL